MKLMWGAAALAVMATALSACADKGQDEAFAAAKAAVAQKLSGQEAGGMKLHHLTGMKGSKADVVCGGALPPNSPDSADPTPFIYIYTLQPAVPDPLHHAGELIVLSPKVDRISSAQLTHFCDAKLTNALPNPYTYFN